MTYADSIENLPERQPDTWYVVSRLTAQARPDRDDLLFPLDEVRDEQNVIVGCRALGRYRANPYERQ